MNRYITLHCAATPNGKPFDIHAIDTWHCQRGFRRRADWMRRARPHLQAVGYQYVITLQGEVQQGRETDETGAHVQGHNTGNIGICMIGTDRFTRQQWDALKLLVADLMQFYPIVAVKGHNDWPGVKKACPGFDVGSWFASGMVPDDRNILEAS